MRQESAVAGVAGTEEETDMTPDSFREWKTARSSGGVGKSDEWFFDVFSGMQMYLAEMEAALVSGCFLPHPSPLPLGEGTCASVVKPFSPRLALRT
ncbi:MAG: hypothetical protein JWM68_1795 [Verrucomicrobiales bacterium]|nr:hypothetical protein [Verrucomicrobiales bacterium]